MSKRILRNIVLLVVAAVGATGVQAQIQAPVAFPGKTAVGSQSAAIAVTVTMTASGTAAVPVVVVQGTTAPTVTPGDFAIASPGGTCAAGTNYSVGNQCTVNVVFQPAFPGQRPGAVEVLSSSGTLLGSQLIVGTATGSLPVLVPGNIQTVVGNGAWVYSRDGIPATQAPIFLPMGVVTDAAGTLYLSDSNNNRVRRVDGQTKIITTVGGNGIAGYSGDGGPAASAMVNLPSGLTMDGAGNLYFADSGNNIVRRIDAVSGIITTVAGTPQTQGFSGDNGPATSARLTQPEGVAFDVAGNLIIVDTGNSVIRKVNVHTGVITTIAGIGGTTGYNGDEILGTAALLNQPWSVAFGPDGTLYIADLNNNRVRSLDSLGLIHTVVGNGQRGYAGDNGSVSQAILNNPAAVAVDPAGDIFIGDSGNDRVRVVTAGDHQINTVAGDGYEQYGGDDGAANLASVYGPYAIYIDGSGNLFVADMFHNRVREVTADLLSFYYPTLRVGKTSSPQITSLVNEGNSSLDVTSYVYNQSALDAATTTCVIGSLETPGNSCNLGVEFAPTVVGTAISGTLTVDSNALNVQPVVQVSGDVLSVNPTTISLASSLNPSLVGNAVTFTATVSGNSGLTGTIAFFDGSTQICSVAIANNAATCTTAGLTLGSHNITADYSGDTQDAAANSAVLVQVVKQAPTLSLAAAPNPTTVGTTVTMTLTATSPTGVPTGSIVFYDGTAAIGSANLNASGVATYPTAALTAGTHSLTAQYSGDATNMAATSNAVSEVINQSNTTTTLATSASPVVVGTTVTFTATVTGSGTGTPTGNVTFTADGTTVLGTSTLNTSGIATLATSALTPGTHTIVAGYVGDAGNGPSNSVGLVEIVNQIGTTTALIVGPNPANAGAPVTLTATVAIAAGATADGAITGNVTFTDGATTLGSAAVNASGVATLPVTTLSVGTHAIIATYSGNTNYAGSSSSAAGEVINSTASAVALGASASPVSAGQNETFTATLTSSTGGIPTGTVTFKDGALVIGTGTVSGTGVATLSTTTLSVGTHTVTASYPGDGNYQPSTSSPVTVVVQLAPTTTALATSANPSVVGQSLTLTASVTSITANPTGNVNFMDGTTLLSSVAVNAAGIAVYTTSSLTFGAHVLTAVYVGDSIHATSTSAGVNEQIVQSAPETLTSSANPATSGTNVTFTATVAGQNGIVPTGQMTFMDGTTTLATVSLTNGVATYTTNALTVGTHSIAASYAGDANYSATSVTITQTITNANTQIALSASANPATYATPVSLTAVITSNGGIATGIVTFTDGGATIGTATLDPTGSAVLTTSALAPGSHSIVANYAGDGKASASVSAPLVLVVKELTQTVVTSSANPATTLAAVTFTAAVTNAGVGVPTGNVTFTDGSMTLGTAAVGAGGTATLAVPSLTAATHTIVASYTGDGADFASTSGSLVETVNLRPTTTSLTGIPTDPTNPNEITLVAVVAGFGTPSPTGTVTFTYGSITLGSSTVGSTGVATLQIFLQQSPENITATYSGDTNYATSTSPVTAISTGTATQFSLNVTPGSATLVSKQRVVVTVTLTSLGSFADTMNLGCLGLPYAATCTFTNSSLKLNANGTATAQLTIDTGNPLGAGGQASVHGLSKSGVLECLLPLGLLLGFGLRRRRKLFGLLAILMVAALTLTASGCAGLQVNGTPPGTYHFTVGATGAGTSANESQTFTLTVTQ